MKEVDKIKKDAIQESVKHVTLLISLFSLSWNGKSWIDLLGWVKTKKIMKKYTIYQLIKEQLKIAFPLLNGKTNDINNVDNVDIIWNLTVSLMSMEYHKDEIERLISEIKESFRSRIGNMRDLYIQIERVIKPTYEARSENAEILTPLSLAEEMINKIPDEFWKEKKTVFEPTCGKGVFLCLAYEKFINAGLDKKTILEECLYFADLNPVNVYICKLLLDRLDEYKLNYYIGNTLELDINKEFNINQFDLVIGNPPYNDNSGNKGKGHTLWTKFVVKTFSNWLKQDGLLVYVHPSLWRQIKHPCLNIIKNKQIKYLEIHNVDDGQKMFRCATRYDWYILENTPYREKTIIKSEDGKINNIDLREWEFIPNMMFEELKLLMNSDDKSDVWRYRSMYGTENKKLVSTLEDNDFKYPLVYTINKHNIITSRYTNDNTKGIFGKSKFIFSNGAGFYCDIKGEYGLTEWAYCIYDIIENLPLIEKAFRSDKFKIIKNAIQLDSLSYNIKVMKLFKKDFWRSFI